MPRKRPRVPRGKLEYVTAQLEMAMAALEEIFAVRLGDGTVLDDAAMMTTIARDALARLESTTYGKREV